MRRTSEGSLLALLEEAWGKNGPASGQLKRNLKRLRHLVQTHSLSSPSVERRNLLIVEPGESMLRRVCYFVRGGLLVDEMEFERHSPPVEELGARIQVVFFGEETVSIEPSKESLEEAVIIAAWLRRELMDGFVMTITGEVKAKDDDTGVVDIEVLGENNVWGMHMQGTVSVQLPRGA